MLVGVVVDLAVWGLNKELTYRVPERFEEGVRVGTIVRVPLKGRRVRGWVTSVDRTASGVEGIVDVAALSGRAPVFDDVLLGVARQLATHYVQPLSAFLSLFTPVRTGRRGALPSPVEYEAGDHLPQLWRLAPGEDPLERYAQIVDEDLAKGAGTIVAVPEVLEGSRILESLEQRFASEAAVVHTGREAAERARALWDVAIGKKKLVLGGRKAVFAPPMRTGTIILHQEDDPSFKHQQAPYFDARRVAAVRAAATGARVLMVSATPSVETEFQAATNWQRTEPVRLAERSLWPAVEVVTPDYRGLPQRAIACLLAARRNGNQSIILLPRLEATAAGPGPEEVMKIVSRVVPGATVARADRGSLEPGSLRAALRADVVVATEAALADVAHPGFETAVAVGVDAYLQRPRGTASQEAARMLWTLASMVSGRRPKGRFVVEVSDAAHHVVEALVRGDYRYFVEQELEKRNNEELPPYRSLIRLQTREDVPPELVDRLRMLPGTRVLGPVPGGSLGAELLLKTSDVASIVEDLGSIVSGAGRRVLVEIDPKDW